MQATLHAEHNKVLDLAALLDAERRDKLDANCEMIEVQRKAEQLQEVLVMEKARLVDASYVLNLSEYLCSVKPISIRVLKTVRVPLLS